MCKQVSVYSEALRIKVKSRLVRLSEMDINMKLIEQNNAWKTTQNNGLPSQFDVTSVYHFNNREEKNFVQGQRVCELLIMQNQIN